jgi:hypothetical protein
MALRDDINANLSNPCIFLEYQNNLNTCRETSSARDEFLDYNCPKHMLQEAQEAFDKMGL